MEEVYKKIFLEDLKKIKEILKKSEEERDFNGKDILNLNFKDDLKVENIVGRTISDGKSFYMKSYGKKEIWIIHHWWDRCRPFVLRPDGNQVDIIIKEGDKQDLEESFNWRDKPFGGDVDD